MSDLFRRTAWAVALASTFLIAGCDDDDNGTDPSPITSPTPSPDPTPSPTPTPTPSASPSPAPGQGVSFLGVARQVDESTGTLRVDGRRVDTDENTIIKNLSGGTLTLGQIPNGEQVRIRGREFSDGSVLAEAITLQQ